MLKFEGFEPSRIETGRIYRRNPKYSIQLILKACLAWLVQLGLHHNAVWRWAAPVMLYFVVVTCNAAMQARIKWDNAAVADHNVTWKPGTRALILIQMCHALQSEHFPSVESEYFLFFFSYTQLVNFLYGNPIYIYVI